jgi:hypothetical protein
MSDGSSARSAASLALERSAELRNAVSSSDLFTQLKAGLKRVTIDGEQFWVAEGDTLLDEDQLAVYALTREQIEAARRANATADMAGLGMAGLAELPSPRLVGITQGGRIVRWAPGAVLTYRLARDSFTSQQRYELVRGGMAEATAAWEETCGVKFQHRGDLDSQPGVGAAGAVFVVREFDAGGQFIAAAFFPNDPRNRRRVLIDPSFFAADLSFDRIGVLRHELGHVLGFRHEHIRSGAPPACPDEEVFGTIDLTQYDPQSVMHYFCGGVGSRELRITAIDRNGSRQVYGPPLSSLQFVEA